MTATARRRAVATVVALLPWPAAVAAQPVPLPEGAILTASDDRGGVLPSGPWRDNAMPTLLTAAPATRQAWRVDGDLDTDAAAAVIAADLAAAGYDVTFDCRDMACGGYDFRYAAGLLPAPAMYVDLGDYRYLLAVRPSGADGTPDALGVLVSRAATAAFIHFAALSAAVAPGPAASPAAPDGIVAPPEPPPDAAATIARLVRDGHLPLDDLDFATGSDALTPGLHASLADLAGWLAADASRRLVLVGHTDSTGSLDANVALSRRRAASVADRLLSIGGVGSGQVSADGVGPLAPRATNATDAGRRANRRVEAVVGW